MSDVDDAIVRAFDFALTEAGFVRSGTSWVYDHDGSFVAFSAVPDEAGSYSLRFGWRYDAFGDPQADPPTAHGCVRSMTLDEVGSLVGAPVGSLIDGVESFEQRLATVVRKHVLRWVESWKRPDGFRDFLADRTLHLGAGWASAMLGHRERARLEFAYAAHLYGQLLDGDFDRARADADAALAAVFAAANGLGLFLAEAPEETVAAFTSERGVTARDKVMNPAAEHWRMQRRHAAYAAVGIAYLQR